MEQKYKFSQVRKHLLSLEPLRFKGIVNPEEKNPKAFLENFFKYNSGRETVRVKDMVITDNPHKRRSIGDIFRITAFYFPKITLTTTYKTLLGMIADGKVISSICKQTGLRVYRGTESGEKAYLNGVLTDEFTTDLTQFEEQKLCKSISGNWGYDFNEKYLNFVEL